MLLFNSMVNSKVKKIKAGIFIDGSNMLWGSKNSGIRLDWEKVMKYIKTNYSPVVFNYYACEDNNPKPEYKDKSLGQKKFYKKLEGIGYSVIRKELKHLACGKTKCDMDVELAMDLRNYEDDIDCIIIFAGDSDYMPVVDYYWNHGKYIRIFSFEESLSWELKTFAINKPRCSYKKINEIRSELERELSTD
jgi:uncharacterized LabA/DUF88 family protein